MRILNENDYQIINLNHPRYKNIEVIQFDNQIWFNLNDLCQSAKTTASSAINSLDEGTPHLVYIQHPGKEDHIPFVTEQGFLLAETERTQAYKKHILNWAYNELQDPILPTIDQMIILSPKSRPSADPILHTTDLHQMVSDANNSKFEPYDIECNLPQLAHRFHQYGNPISAKSLLKWLLKHQYCSTAPDHKYRPQDRWYNAGYFVDNRHTFNPLSPQHDILFTPKGQRYFFEKLSPEK